MPGVSYASASSFFGEPDEEVAEAPSSRREPVARKRGRWETNDGTSTRRASDELSTPTKRRYTSRDATPPPHTPKSTGLRALTPPPLGLPFGMSSVASTSSLATPAFPGPLADLFSLYTALESVLLFHLANEGARVASSASRTNAAGVGTIRLPNLIDLPDLMKKIESSGRRFTERELATLVWVWSGCGIRNEDEEEDEELEIGGEEVGGMGFIVTKMRCGISGNIVTTYGLGISVTIKSNPQLPKLELIPSATSTSSSPGSPARTPEKKVVVPPSPTSIGRGRAGMSIVALWSQGNDSRREEFGRRLREWGRRCADEEAKQVCLTFPL